MKFGDRHAGQPLKPDEYKHFRIGGKIRDVSLNGHTVSVIAPRKRVSYEEGAKRIDRIIAEIKGK